MYAKDLSSGITADDVRRLLDYNPATGHLYWKWRNDLQPKAKSWNDRNAGKRLSYIDGKGYGVVRIYKKAYRAHRVVWLYCYGEWPKLDIDHINRVKTDNRIVNLREATVAQNGHNVGLTNRNSSGHRGVFWHVGGKKWQAGISCNRQEIYLGLFSNLDDAIAARVEAEKKYYGEYSVLSQHD